MREALLCAISRPRPTDAMQGPILPHHHRRRDWRHAMTTATPPLNTPFDARSSAEEVLADVDLSGRRAIVTGASSGIGTETARVLALRGAAVTLTARDPGTPIRHLETCPYGGAYAKVRFCASAPALLSATWRSGRTSPLSGMRPMPGCASSPTGLTGRRAAPRSHRSTGCPSMSTCVPMTSRRRPETRRQLSVAEVAR